MQNSYEEGEKNNRILKECALSRKKHEELEKRYKNLVDPEISYLSQIAKIKKNNEKKRSGGRETGEPEKVGLSGERESGGNAISETKKYTAVNSTKKAGVSHVFEAEDDVVKPISELEKDFPEPENKYGPETEIGKNPGDADRAIQHEQFEKETVGYTAAAVESYDNNDTENPEGQVASNSEGQDTPMNFKRYFERELSPILSNPEFEIIREFIEAGNDFSREEYQSILNEYGNASGADSPVEPEEKPEEAAEPLKEYMPESVGVVYASPLENNIENVNECKEPVKVKIIKAALALTVLITTTTIIYNIW